MLQKFVLAFPPVFPLGCLSHVFTSALISLSTIGLSTSLNNLQFFSFAFLPQSNGRNAKEEREAFLKVYSYCKNLFWHFLLYSSGVFISCLCLSVNFAKHGRPKHSLNNVLFLSSAFFRGAMRNAKEDGRTF
jgi:hypothetical protein